MGPEHQAGPSTASKNMKPNFHFALQLPFAVIGLPTGWLYKTILMWFDIGVEIAKK